MKTDAKVFGMIADLSRGSLAELLGLSPDLEHSHLALHCAVREAYENGTISGDDIIAAWNDEGE